MMDERIIPSLIALRPRALVAFEARRRSSLNITNHPSREGRAAWLLGATLVASFFCLPLFVGLDAEDLRNDEAIYSYAVDRMVETGDWITPRAIPFDGPFLEKPPLKIWLVAGLIKSGVVPHDERGLRTVDALFGAAAFIYIYAIGALLAGPICGVAAVLLLFLFDPLVLEHGVRSNNMEAALLLAYCGALFHLARWADGPAARQRAHAYAVAVWFTLGFLTKFVAVLFLPVVAVLALAWRVDASARWRSALRMSAGPALLVVVLCAPWFIAASVRHGRLVWDVMLGQHVLARFTGSLDPEHIQPWSFYVATMWMQLARDGVQWLVAAGLIGLMVCAWRGRPWLARLILVWAVMPLVLMSFGTSKLFHYAYPFVPPLALGAGAVIAALVAVVTGPRVAALFGRWPGALAARGHSRPAGLIRGLLLAAALVAFLVAILTAIDGRVLWQLAGGRFSNASIARPLILGSWLLWLGAAPLASLHMWIVVPLMMTMSAATYEAAVVRLRQPDHPLHTIRDCTVKVQRTAADAGRGLYNASRAKADHPYFYYLRGLGEWTFADAPDAGEVRRRLRVAAAPVLVASDDFAALVAAVGAGQGVGAPGTRASLDDPAESAQTMVSGVIDRFGIILVLPGPYQTCVAPALGAGWRAIGTGASTRVDR